MKKFFNNWDDSYEGMLDDFGISPDDETIVPDEDEVILATYTYEDYSGSAFVLFKRDGVFYEVNGSHCSCYGLEDQWRPEQTSFGALAMRERNGRWNFLEGHGEAQQAFWDFIDSNVN